MRFVESCFLVIVGASLLGGCAPFARDTASSDTASADTAPPDRVLLQYTSGPPGKNTSSIVFLPKNVELPPATPVNVVILDPSSPRNAAFCSAVLKNENSLSSFLPLGKFTQEARTITWLENRSSAELKDADTRETSCPQRLDNFDYQRARELAYQFSLFGSDGPWLLSFDPKSQKAVLLDFSGYEEAKYDRKLAKWREHIANNTKFWAAPQFREISGIFLGAYATEILSGHLKFTPKR